MLEHVCILFSASLPLPTPDQLGASPLTVSRTLMAVTPLLTSSLTQTLPAHNQFTAMRNKEDLFQVRHGLEVDSTVVGVWPSRRHKLMTERQSDHFSLLLLLVEHDQPGLRSRFVNLYSMLGKV